MFNSDSSDMTKRTAGTQDEIDARQEVEEEMSERGNGIQQALEYEDRVAEKLQEKGFDESVEQNDYERRHGRSVKEDMEKKQQQNNHHPQNHSSNLFNKKVKNGYNNNGYQGKNNAKDSASSLDTRAAQELGQGIKNKMANAKKKVAREAIRKGLNAYMPGAGEVADKVLKTEKGEKLLDAYEKGDGHAEGIKNVANELNKKKRIRRIISGAITFLLPLLFLVLIVVVIFKNADTQIYSNQNGGTVESENYGFDNVGTNIFATYPGLFEKIAGAVDKVSKQYKIEIDRYIILATLLAPIDNGLVTPVNREDITSGDACSEDQCYRMNGKYMNWTDFVKAMGDQAELLAKMQVLTYKPTDEDCGEATMEQYAKNDDEIHTFHWLGWLNPVNWFKGYTDAAGAEKNYVCVDVPNPSIDIFGNKKIQNVTTHSIGQGKYTAKTDASGNVVYTKDSNSGGVYFWNLVNENGFLYTYLKDYLSDAGGSTDDHVIYETNLPTILTASEYIYSYYDSIKKSCQYPKEDYHKILKSEIKTIKIFNPESTINNYRSRYGIVLEPNMEIDFEDQYIGGVMLAEFNSGNEEALKAFAILARTEAIANVGVDGTGTIENSSNRQNYNPSYSAEKYPKIAQAVKDTRGVIVGKFDSEEVWHTEYDAFCPVKVTLDNGYYWLPDEQQNLPINPSEYKKKTGKEFISSDSKYLDCPCFQNQKAKPHDEIIDRQFIRWSDSTTNPPNYAGGNPSQTTKEVCWKLTNETNGSKVGWKYNPTGGHGRGASQYGLKYFGAFGYSQDALIRLFFPGAQLRILQSSIEEGWCIGVDTMDLEKKDEGDQSGSGDDSYSSGGEGGYNEVIRGKALNTTLKQALANKGYTISDLNNCIAGKVNSAGYATRDGVVMAGVGLIQCVMDMTGGYAMPYDHNGGKIYWDDLNNKLGVNSHWGEIGGVGCQDPPCRYGLNCANFVRWSFCNGGMNMCNQGSAGARSQTGAFTNTNYYPGAVRINTANFSVMTGPTDISSADEAIAAIKPGDVLYSDTNGEGQHAMLIVGKESNSITIAENGRGTRKISFSELKNGKKTYVVVLLDKYYEEESNKNSLSW